MPQCTLSTIIKRLKLRKNVKYTNKFNKQLTKEDIQMAKKPAQRSLSQ
jgi:hypothetical protein